VKAVADRWWTVPDQVARCHCGWYAQVRDATAAARRHVKANPTHRVSTTRTQRREVFAV